MNQTQAEFEFIHKNVQDYTVTELVNRTTVSRSGYYKWLKNKNEDRQKVKDQEDEETLSYIKEIHQEHKGTYGRKRIKIALDNIRERPTSEKKISRIMNKYGLHCEVRRKSFKNRKQPHGDIPNLLNQNFRARKPGIKFAIDITYVRVKKGSNKWVYVCAIKDLCNGEIVAYAESTSQSMTLVHQAINELKRYGFVKGAILHSDQGFQFTNPIFQERLKKLGLTQSMSRRGNCWDNACIENFFGHLKCEMPQFEQPETVEEIYNATKRYIDYYNYKRIQTKLKMSPVSYRKQIA